MNEQIITDVLNDILVELKESNQSLKTLQTTVKDLQDKTAGFEQKLTDQQVIAPPADTTPIQELTGKAIDIMQQEMKKELAAIRTDVIGSMMNISTIVEAQPKNVIKQWRLSFFPDNDFNGSFKHLVNKITLGMICITLIGAGYKLGLHYLDRPVSAAQAAAPQTFGSAARGPAASEAPVPPPTITKGRHHHDQEVEKKNKLDTLYKKYMRRRTDSLYELR